VTVPKKQFGQHFLVDDNILGVIGRLAELDARDIVLEIGPGLGVLTSFLADRVGRVHAVEIDASLEPQLAATAARPNVDLRFGDALRLDLSALSPPPSKLVSNLPYNVATPVVIRLLEEVPAVTSGLVMVQREVAERLVAAPGSAAYGAPSVKVAYYAEAKIVGMVPRAVFVPVPKVDSALVELVRRDTPPVDVPSRERLFQLVRAGFAHRRKMLRRTLRPVLGEHAERALSDAGIDPRARAESLGLDEWAALARAEAPS
jgi:16S rRNA (adenine1518-N6/adenine1519-N6)-dimethyltransferase